MLKSIQGIFLGKITFEFFKEISQNLFAEKIQLLSSKRTSDLI